MSLRQQKVSLAIYIYSNKLNKSILDQLTVCINPPIYGQSYIHMYF